MHRVSDAEFHSGVPFRNTSTSAGNSPIVDRSTGSLLCAPNPALPFYWLSLSTTDGESASVPQAAPAAQATATPTPSLSVARTITYTYDAVGNRLTQNDNGTLTNYTYDIANRLTNVNAQVYTWDNNGNLLNDGTSAYTYDQANRIKTLTQGTNNYAFAYNGLSDRISQTVGVTQTRYTLDPAAGLTQVLSDGTATYLYGLGRIAQQQTNMQYFGADGLASVRQMYNSSGQIVANHRYDPFGNTISQSGVGTSNYGFTGEWTDATGLEYLRARYYAPTQGRFTTRDVWEGDPNAPMSYNAWNYVYANPVNRIDPTGRNAVAPRQQALMSPSTLALGIVQNLNAGANYSLLTMLGECWWRDAPPAVVKVVAGISANPVFEGYFFGISLAVTEVSSGPWRMKIWGTDYVFDFKHQQSALFTYESTFARSTTAIGVEVSSYEGLIHGFDAGVADYHGPFVTVSLGVDVPELKILGAGVSAFSSAPDSSPCTPNFKMWGIVGYATPSIGVSLPIPASGSLSCTSYTMQRQGFFEYPNGIAGGMMIAYAILALQPLDPIREYAAELAIQWGVINQFGQ